MKVKGVLSIPEWEIQNNYEFIPLMNVLHHVWYLYMSFFCAQIEGLNKTIHTVGQGSVLPV